MLDVYRFIARHGSKLTGRRVAHLAATEAAIDTLIVIAETAAVFTCASQAGVPITLVAR